MVVKKQNRKFKNAIISDEENNIILTLYDLKKLSSEYLLELEIRNYSQNTIKTYSSILKNFIKFISKSPKPLNKQQFSDNFRSYIQFLKNDKNLSPDYIHLITIVVKKFLSYNHIYFLEDFPIPKKAKSLPKSLNEKEVHDLINSVEWSENDSSSSKHTKMRDKLILSVLYSTGLRVSELIEIKIQDIDFSERTIFIKGKGNKERIVLFDKDTKEEISAYLNFRVKKSEYLLVNNYGHPLSARYIQMMIKKYAEKAEIKKNVTPHVLRHSYATHLLKRGVDIRIIQQLLGHSSILSTQIYTNVEMDIIRNVYDNAKQK